MRLRTFLPALAILTAAGCDSALRTEPVDRVPVDQAIVDAPGARAALIGAYDALQDLSYYGTDLLVLGDLSADNADHVGTYQFLGQVSRNQLQADNSSVEGLWQAIYAGIGRVNLILARVPDVPGLGATERDQILGEARFLRALHYHNLVKLWGDVPMPLAPVASAAEAAAFQRTPATDVYAQIITDLDAAAQLIANSSQTRQASLGAVRALRARVLLYKGDWAGAETAANAVLAMGYSLATSYPALFTPDGTDTPEDIFRVSFTPQEYNEMGYYYLWDGRWEVAPSEDLYGSYEPGDVRRDWSVEEDDGEFQGTKFPTTIGGEDIHVIRLAEVMLIRAEALARQGRLADAVAAYNPVRVRASLDPHVFGRDVSTQAQVLDAIWQERRVELALEGDRWPDLVRTGRVAAVLGLPADRAYQALYPIPAAERVVSPQLTQNPGY